MKPSHFILSICSGLLVGTSLSNVSYAQNARFYGQASPWQVADVRGDDSGGHEYCVLSRAYSSDVAITIAENRAGESSIALHFLKGQVNVGGADRTILDPGAGQQREFSSIPLDDSSVMVKIGRDNAFFDALRKTGFMRVGLNGQSYNFDISDFEQGQSQLKACIATLAAPAAPVVAQAQPSPVVERGTQMPVAKVEADAVASPVPRSSSTQAASPLAAADSVSRASSPPAAAVARAAPPPPPAGVAAQASSRAEDLAKSQAEIVALRDEIKRLEDRLSVSRASEKNLAELSSQVQILAQENASLKEKQVAPAAVPAAASVVQPRPQDSAAIADLTKRVEALLAENDALKQKQAAAVGTSNDQLALQKQLIDAEARQRELTAQIDHLQREKTMLSQQAKASAEQVASLESISAVNVAADSAQNEQLAMLRNRNAELTKTIEQAQASQNDLQKKLEAEAQKVAALQGQVAAAQEGKASDIQGYEQKVAALQGELSAAKSALEAAQAAQVAQARNIAALKADGDKVADLQAQLAAAEQQRAAAVAAHQREMQAVQAELAEVRRGLEASTADKIAEIKGLQEERSRLLARLETLEKSNAEIQLVDQGVQDQLRSLRAENTALAAENASLKEHAEAHGAQIASLKDTLEKMRGAQDKLAVRLQESDAALKQSQAREKDLTQKLAAAEDGREKALAQVASAAAVTAVPVSAKGGAEIAAPVASVSGGAAERNVVAKSVSEPVASIANTAPEASLASVEPAADERILTAEELRRAQEDAAQRNARAVKQEVAAPAPVVDEVVSQTGVAAAQRELPVREAVRAPVVEDIIPEPYEVAAAQRYENEAQRLEHELMKEIERGEKLAVKPRAEPVVATKVQEVAKEAAPDMSSQAHVHVREAERAVAANTASVVAEVEQVEALKPEPQFEETAVQPQLEPVHAEALPPSGQQGEAAKVAAAGAADKADASVSAVVVQDRSQNTGSIRETISPNMPHSNGKSVEALLADAGIRPSQGVQPLASRAPQGVVGYQWIVGDVYGSSEQQRLADAEEFDRKVKEYLVRTEANCNGDFAVIPSDSVDYGSMRVDAYDIACVNGGAEKAASLLFYNQNGYFSAISHGGEASDMEVAMTLRDNLIRSFSDRS